MNRGMTMVLMKNQLRQLSIFQNIIPKRKKNFLWMGITKGIRKAKMICDMKRQITISAKKLKNLKPKQRQRSAPPTKVVPSKKKYKRKSKWGGTGLGSLLFL